MEDTPFFRASILSSNVGFCAMTLKGTIIISNEALNSICSDLSLEGKQLFDVINASKRETEEFLQEVNQKTLFVKEVSIKSKGEPYYALANASVVRENDEAFIAIFFTELNQQKNLEIRLEERIAEEVEKNRETERMMHQQSKLATMGEMIGNIAHQWRQPLNILALVLQDIYIKFQLKSLDYDTMEKNYEKANNLLQYMSQTIDDFRTFFKHEEKDEPFDIEASLQTVFELVGTRFTSNKTKCEVEIIHNGKVLGTENGFKQVVINLLNNAQEAILSKRESGGYIDIVVNTSDDSIVIEVKDNGGGVPEEILEQVFEPYFTTKHQTQGTGLGLYMSKQIIEHNMRGKLEVRNSKEGAIFSITLPLNKD